MKDKKLSVVIPVYNEEESIPELLEWIFRVVETHSIEAEVILIDDGSSDGSWQVISDKAQEQKRIVGLRLNRNHGKSDALQVGFEAAHGDVILTMDADMQDSPDEIPELMRMVLEDQLDVVSGWKKKRHDPISKTIPSKFFNWVTRKVSGIQLHDFNCGLKAYRKEVVKNIRVYGEMHRYIPLIAKWNGFDRIGEKVVKHRARKYGVSKYGVKRFITGFLDLLSVTFVNRFRKNPMHFFGVLGSLSFVGGGIITIWIIAEKLIRQYAGMPIRPVVDQPLFFLALVALIVGMQLFLVGFIAEMLTRNYQEKSDHLIAERVN